MLALAELWFAAQGFNRPAVLQVVLEVVGLAVLGACVARFAPSGWARSPLWAGVFALAGMAIALGPSGWTGAPFIVGTLVLAGWTVWRLERSHRSGMLAGLVVAVLGAVGARGLVLAKAGENSGGQQSSVVVSPWLQLKAELLGVGFRDARPAPRDGPPVVLITVDTLRADATAGMQTWKRLAERGATWDRAMSTSSWTVPAMGTVLTGLAPGDHGAGVSAEGTFQGVGEVDTLASRLSDHGYTTAGFASNAWLTHTLGFDKGFQTYAHTSERFHHRLLLAGFPRGPKPHEAASVVDRALRWLGGAPEQGWFLWVHLIDPHLPYVHAEGTLAPTLTDERLRAGMRVDGDVPQRVRDAYAQEVAYTDGELGRLVDALEARGVLDDGIVVLTADHGEEFWDHGATGHGHQHHTEVVDVALAVTGPGVSSGPRHDLASLVDVAPTILAMVGLEADGHDLREPLPEGRIAVAQGNAYFSQHRSARQGRWRVIVGSPGDEPVTCFDTVADPREQRSVPCPEGHPVVHAALQSRPPGATGDSVHDIAEALEALGYVVDDRGAVPEPSPPPEPEPAP